MELIAEHVLEPELTAPVPRRLRLPRRTRLLLAVAVLLLGMFAFGSGRALWEGAKLSWLNLCGRTLAGQIIEIRTEPAAVKGQPPRQTALRYGVTGARGAFTQTGWIALGAPAALPGGENAAAPPARFHVGQPFPLRSASLGGITVCRPWGPGAGSRILTLLIAGGLVFAVSLRLLRRLLRWAGSREHLLRFGTATVGTITHKRSEAEDMVRYFLRYGYPGGPAEGREEQVSAEQWREFHVGQPVTVLYDPDLPDKAGLYALIAQK